MICESCRKLSKEESFQLLHIEKGEDILDHMVGSQNDPMVIKVDIANFIVHKVLVDDESLIDVLFSDV